MHNINVVLFNTAIAEFVCTVVTVANISVSAVSMGVVSAGASTSLQTASSVLVSYTIRAEAGSYGYASPFELYEGLVTTLTDAVLSGNFTALMHDVTSTGTAYLAAPVYSDSIDFDAFPWHPSAAPITAPVDAPTPSNSSLFSLSGVSSDSLLSNMNFWYIILGVILVITMCVLLVIVYYCYRKYATGTRKLSVLSRLSRDLEDDPNGEVIPEQGDIIEWQSQDLLRRREVEERGGGVIPENGGEIEWGGVIRRNVN